MAILSIQSRVSYGYVGNSIAVPAIQAAGLEVWPLDTVSFSNHPGHGQFRGRTRDPAELQAELEGLDALGVLDGLSAALSGYLGHPGSARAITDAVLRTRRVRPDLPYILDPVIGDHGRRFVADGVAEAIRDELLPLSDIITPNLFELGVLAGQEIEEKLPAIVGAARSLISANRLTAVAVTGIERPDRVSNLLVTAEHCCEASSPRLARGFNGTGDLFAALLAAWFVKTEDARSAFARAAGGLELATRVTDRADRRELFLPAILKGLKSCRPAALTIHP
ncbi:pyridoxal kinase [Nisaea acidiphila]|uniref:pyridoxal kinase n=1 Tax=Nisaea acidiphila TaxID=1862145 RepID=A0A9J7AKN4_9PROT|nr:pyridoxal kinase [Nisaea acidiphila]UUX48048.1 pyridoxal kinase [Nisaea acidiphila]